MIQLALLHGISLVAIDDSCRQTIYSFVRSDGYGINRYSITHQDFGLSIVHGGSHPVKYLVKDLVKNNFPKSLSSVVKPFVLSLSKHDRLDAVGEIFPLTLRQAQGERKNFTRFTSGSY